MGRGYYRSERSRVRSAQGRALQARIDKARDEAANGIEFTMHGGRGGYAKRLCRIIEILKGDDETDSAQ